jgi:excisionase family DNA binding protein
MRPVKPSEVPTLLNERQVSELLAIPVKTLQYWRCEGRELPFIKLGSHVRYAKADILEYIAENRRVPSPPLRDTY